MRNGGGVHILHSPSSKLSLWKFLAVDQLVHGPRKPAIHHPLCTQNQRRALTLLSDEYEDTHTSVLRYSNYNTYTEENFARHAHFFKNITPAISALIFKCYPHSSKYERRETDSEEETEWLLRVRWERLPLKGNAQVHSSQSHPDWWKAARWGKAVWEM